MQSKIEYKKIPENPGCYLFKDKNGKVVYVGKAKNLKKRVTSYFLKNEHDPKTALLINSIESLDYYITNNEIEALILENNLIKRLYPKFNIDLKDSRRYAYLRVTNDEFPCIEVARTREEAGQYFGPFISGKLRREIQIILERHFGILTRKPSLLRVKSLNKEEYHLRLKKGINLLKGDINELSKSLEREMIEASQKKNYEHALRLKKQIEALQILKEKQNMEMRRNYDSDIINYIVGDNFVYLLLFNVYQGVLENKQEFEFPYGKNFLDEFILQYYENNPLPREIILPNEIDKSLIDYLKNREKKLQIIFPKIGPKKALLDLALKNVGISMMGEELRVYELEKSLKLAKTPRIIECFDISHIRGKYTVASMVTFTNGKPTKSNYRKFKILQNTNGDDYLAIREVIYRRYAKSLRDTLPNPDLIVIDGGAGQLSSALSILKELKLEIPIISLAKKLEEIYVPGKILPHRFEQKNAGLLLLRAIRDEAHRFAISYNRKLRSKNLIGRN